MTVNNNQKIETGVENVNKALPPCWYIEYRRHGQVTLRQEEADSALKNGAIRVTAYSSAAPLATPLTNPELSTAVAEYGPQSEDEEAGFRDGFRAAERHYCIGAAPDEQQVISSRTDPAPKFGSHP